MTARPQRTAQLVRAIAAHATPVLISQLAGMSTTIIDTVIAGHVGTIDLAAVGIGSGIYISVMLAFAGVVQGLTPIAAQHFGARHFDALPRSFQQGIWLALLLGIVGACALSRPNWILHTSSMSVEVETRTRAYLTVLAWGLPGTLIYRACGGMLNALGKPRMLMFFGLGNALVHLVLAPTLAFGWLGGQPLGVVGCATGMVINNCILALFSMLYLARSPISRSLHLLTHWQPPRPGGIVEILRVGLPIGMSAFVEITSFALIALMVAPLGPEVVGAHRILGSFGGICYMLPLSISIATLALVGHAAGARDIHRVRKTVRAGLVLGIGASALLGLTLWLFAAPLVRAYTPDPRVRAITLSLIGLIAFYQLFDALQTVAAQALRGLKITTQPMLIHVVSFWGVGLAGGWWLCYRGADFLQLPAQGMGGFWWAATVATVIASMLFSVLLRYSLKRLEYAPRPGARTLSPDAHAASDAGPSRRHLP